MAVLGGRAGAGGRARHHLRGSRRVAHPDDGLYGLGKEHLDHDPLSGEMYLFVSSARGSEPCRPLLVLGSSLMP